VADGKSILDQLIEEAAAAGAKAAQADDFVLKLSSTDKDGNHYEVEGVPASKAGTWLRDHFGIGGDEGKGDEGKGDEGKGDEGKGNGQPAGLRSLFPQQGKGKAS
jgi:hypothetical protein